MDKIFNVYWNSLKGIRIKSEDQRKQGTYCIFQQIGEEAQIKMRKAKVRTEKMLLLNLRKC